MSDQQTDNLALWNAVCETDVSKIKEVDYGFKHHAIDATYQRRNATALWGPYGMTWGLRNLKWGYVGSPPLDLWLEAEFFWPDGSFELSSDIKFASGKHCRKKLQTDTLTKALSMLGFNSDVWEGRFEDAPYHDAVGSAVMSGLNLADDIVNAMLAPKDADHLERMLAAAKSKKLNRFGMDKVMAAYSQAKRNLESTDEAEKVF